MVDLGPACGHSSYIGRGPGFRSRILEDNDDDDNDDDKDDDDDDDDDKTANNVVMLCKRERAL